MMQRKLPTMIMRSPSTIRIAMFFTIVAAASWNSAAQRPEPSTSMANVRSEVRRQLEEWHKAGKFPGATVGIVMANGESFGVAVGVSDREQQTPMKPSDRMLAGSVGKTFAAAAALRLVKKGKISLDDRIEKYLGREPWFPRLPNAKEVTVRQLMNHTSGIVRYEFKEQFTKDLTENPDKIWKPEEQIAYVFDETAPFAAGTGWEYSDTNYIILGMIIERVTGKRFYDEAIRRFTKPLRLQNTIPQVGRTIEGLVPGYAGPNNPFGGTDKMISGGRFTFDPQLEWTGGGWASTSEDLARWAKLMYEGKAFDPAWLPQMLDGVPAKLGPNTKYGLGVIIRPTTAGLTYGHSGFFPGYMTDMMYFPDTKIAIAIQVNTSVPQDLGKPLARVLVDIASAIR